MAQINITRDKNGEVVFDTISINPAQTVFFTNLDPKEAHWPTLASNKLGAAPSLSSSECPVPVLKSSPPYTVQYSCRITGHEDELGTINVVPPLAAADNTTLEDATKGQPITEQPVVVGGVSPYTVTGQLFQITDPNGNTTKPAEGIGPGLKLDCSKDNSGITVSGIPTASGTYNFTFKVNDGIGGNLQQVQYSMKVS